VRHEAIAAQTAAEPAEPAAAPAPALSGHRRLRMFIDICDVDAAGAHLELGEQEREACVAGEKSIF
jgi:hypothetical protein